MGPLFGSPHQRSTMHDQGALYRTRGQVFAAADGSLVCWALLLLVTLKYALFVLHADHHGEGGVFALIGLLQGATFLGAGILTGLLILSAGLLYGEGLITPAISILSAVEGLQYLTDRFSPYVVWKATCEGAITPTFFRARVPRLRV
jgi:K+ transporter